MDTIRTGCLALSLVFLLSLPNGTYAGAHTPYLTELFGLAPLTKWEFPISHPSLVLRYAILPSSSNQIPNGTKADIAVIGDSFAHPLVGLFSDIAKRRNLKVLLATSPSCAAFFDKVAMDTTTKFDNAEKDVLCKKYTRPALRTLMENSKARVIVLAGNWAGTHQIWRAAQDPKHGTSLQETVKILTDLGKKVIVLGMIPGSHHDVASCIAKKSLKECQEKTPVADLSSKPHTPTSSKLLKGRNRLRDVVRKIMEDEVKKNPKNVAYVDPYRALCSSTTECTNVRDGKAVYYDDHHLSAYGGLLMKPAFKKALQALSAW